MAQTSARRRSARGPAAQTVLPEEIWEEIFLRLDAAADLVRVSATCSSFDRIVSARRFRQGFRSLHPAPVLGFFRNVWRDFLPLPVGPPHRFASEARWLVQAADFTFSFLPDPHAWYPHDARDGRVLLSSRISSETRLWDFVVCDPLHRRYVKIPRIPDDLLAASTVYDCHLLPVLAPAGENDQEESFRVFCAAYNKEQGKIMAFVFSSCNQTWQASISTIHFPNDPIRNQPYYAHGCLYWMFGGKGRYSLMLDTNEMKFSTIALPPHDVYSLDAIVEATDGRLGFLTISDDTIDLYSKNRQSNGIGTQEWHHDKLIPLPKVSGVSYSWHIVGTAGRYLVLVAHVLFSVELSPTSEYFVLDIKTLLVEKLCTFNDSPIYGFPYARFPPPLALPTI